MEKEFIPYTEALALKELGFDEPCLSYYTGDKMHLVIRPFMLRANELESYVVTAPLYQQAFRWFREKYGIVGYCYIPNESGYWGHSFEKKAKYYTYEEAQLECLKKLIEIVRKNEVNSL
jgi:hypothetical protein